MPLADGKGLVKNLRRGAGLRGPPVTLGEVAGGGAVALSMEEQRILDEIERKLAADDPRMASRFNSFGQHRLPGAFTSARARTISCLVALALIAAVTVMMFVLSPMNRHSQPPHPRATATSTVRSGSPAISAGDHPDH